MAVFGQEHDQRHLRPHHLDASGAPDPVCAEIHLLTRYAMSSEENLKNSQWSRRKLLTTAAALAPGAVTASVPSAGGKIEVWDLHVHLNGFAGRTPSEKMSELIRVADRIGVDRVCLFMGYPFVYDPTPEQLRQQNDQVLEALAHSYSRAFGFVYLNPNHLRGSLPGTRSLRARRPDDRYQTMGGEAGKRSRSRPHYRTRLCSESRDLSAHVVQNRRQYTWRIDSRPMSLRSRDVIRTYLSSAVIPAAIGNWAFARFASRRMSIWILPAPTRQPDSSGKWRCARWVRPRYIRQRCRRTELCLADGKSARCWNYPIKPAGKSSAAI